MAVTQRGDDVISPIVSIEVIPVSARGPDTDTMDTSSTTVVVRLTDADGRQGIGEADAPPSTIKAFLEMQTEHTWSQTIAQMLLGMDPVETGANWEKLYLGTLYPGRRGLGIHALSAVDIAMHDLAGKQLGLPVYKLLGGARRTDLFPYCTIYPGEARPDRPLSDLIAESERQIDVALGLGFQAVKLELIYGSMCRDSDLVEIVRQAKLQLGDRASLALDFGYRWTNAGDARQTLRRLIDFDIAFAEAPLQHDDLHGHARLAAHGDIKICGAEFATTRWEIREWIEVGKVHVVQPDITRCGGFTEMRRIADLCEMHGVELIPHGWKTGILVAASSHFHATHAACSTFEFLSPAVFSTILRKELTHPEAEVKNGRLPLPQGPGLGVSLNESAVAKFLVQEV